jgi:type VI secretion system secreted protein Hcp
MATPVYMTITGAKQGNITAGASSAESIGNKFRKEHIDKITIYSYDHQVYVPSNNVSGQTTGSPVHNAVKVSKPFDKSSPLLRQALSSGESLTQVEISWYRTAQEGDLELYYTTVLTGARIVNIRAYMRDIQDPDGSHVDHMEEVEFCYDEITSSHVVSNTTSVDDLRK